MHNPGRHGRRLDFGHLGGTSVGGDPDSWFPEMWDWLAKKYSLQSMLDIGCGVGQAQMYFERKLAVATLGIDCEQVLKHHVLKDPRYFDAHDLTTGPYIGASKFDLVWCCEVAEHIEEKFVGNLLETVVANCRKVFCLCAAPKGAGGYHHVNCQDSPYWIEKFESAGLKHQPDLTAEGRRLSPGAVNGRCVSYFARSGLIFTCAE